MLLTVPSADAGSDAGDLLWEDEFAISEIAASDGRVVAIGTVTTRQGSRTAIVRVYDAKTGTRLWQVTVAADSVILDDDRVVVAGDGAVQAYNAKTGDLVWRDRPPFVVTQLYRDEDTALATAVSAAGTAIRIRTYDTRRGTVLVRDQTLPLAGVTTFHAGKLFAAASVPVDFEGTVIHPCQVRAYSIATGELLWVTTQPVLVPNTTDCGPVAITAERKRVVLAGIGSFFNDFMAQAYDARTGEFLWQHLSLIGTSLIDAAVTVDIERRLAFVGGWTRNPFSASTLNQDFVIRALDVDTGALRWEARSPGADCPPAPQRCLAHAKLVVADSETVYGAGFQGESGNSIPGTGFLRAYDSKSGRLRWQQTVDVEAMDATHGTVLVLTPSTGADAILQAYDGK